MVRTKSELEEMSKKDMDFLDWVRHQTEAISSFSRIIEQIQPGQESISMSRLREVLAKYTEFYVIQTAFSLIYKEYKQIYEKEYEELRGTIYLEIKTVCSNPDYLGGLRS